MSQLILQTPTNKLNTAGALSGLWYPPARPLKIWRKTLGSTLELNGTIWLYNGTIIFVDNNSFMFHNTVVELNRNPYSFVFNGVKYTLVASSPDLVFTSTNGTVVLTSLETVGPCDLAQSVYETPLKNIKKPCDSCSPGSVISFSGYAGIKPATTNVSKGYFPNNYQYLRNRGNTFNTTSVLHKIPGVNYVSGANPVWPVVPQTVDGQPVTSASFAYNNVTCNPSKFLIYKPNNSGFSTQGAVASSTRLWKLKYAPRPELTQFQKKALKAQLKK